MTGPTSADLAAAIANLNSAAEELRGAAEHASDAIQTAVTGVEEAAGHLDLEELPGDDSWEQELADQVARMHYDEHGGALRFCSREACRTAHEVGTDVTA